MNLTKAEVLAQRAERGHFCGFCSTSHHHLCPRAVRNGSLAPAKISTCDCRAEGKTCGDRILRCLECKTEVQEEIDPNNWSCFDQGACEQRIQERLNTSEVYQKIRKVRETAMARVANEKVEKAASTPKSAKVGKCLVTGKPTKGGKFLPGMDARYVSLRVAEVVDGSATEAATRKRIKDETGSEALEKKFNRSLELARERDVKRADAAKAKAADKKAKAAAKA